MYGNVYAQTLCMKSQRRTSQLSTSSDTEYSLKDGHRMAIGVSEWSKQFSEVCKWSLKVTLGKQKC